MIAEGLGALTVVMAESRGPHWNVPDEKLRRVGTAYGRVIEHYFPAEAIGEASLFGGAAIATGAAFGPPLIIDAMRANAMRQVEAQRRAGFGTHTPPQPPPVFTPPPAPPSPADLPNMSDEQMQAAAAEAWQIIQGMFGGGAADGNATEG